MLNLNRPSSSSLKSVGINSASVSNTEKIQSALARLTTRQKLCFQEIAVHLSKREQISSVDSFKKFSIQYFKLLGLNELECHELYDHIGSFLPIQQQDNLFSKGMPRDQDVTATVLSNLDHSELNSLDLKGIDLSGADLTCFRAFLLIKKIDLSGANLSGANLSGVNLQGANLSDANLSGANLLGANLQGATLFSSTLIQCQNLEKARFSGVKLEGSKMCYETFLTFFQGNSEENNINLISPINLIHPESFTKGDIQRYFGNGDFGNLLTCIDQKMPYSMNSIKTETMKSILERISQNPKETKEIISEFRDNFARILLDSRSDYVSVPAIQKFIREYRLYIDLF